MQIKEKVFYNLQEERDYRGYDEKKVGLMP